MLLFLRFYNTFACWISMGLWPHIYTSPRCNCCAETVLFVFVSIIEALKPYYNIVLKFTFVVQKPQG